MLSAWKELCRLYRGRRLFRSWKIELKFFLWNLRIDQIDLHQQNNNAWNDAMDYLRNRPPPVLQAMDRLARKNLALHTNVLHNGIWFFAVLVSMATLAEVLFGINLHKDLQDWLLSAFVFLIAISLILVVLSWITRQHAIELSCLIGITMVQRGIYPSDGR